MGLKLHHHKSCEAAAAEAGRELAKVVSAAKHPLLLLSGGSSLNAARVMITRLSSKDLKKLTVAQIDARYVPPEHPASNWGQISKIFEGYKKLDENLAIFGSGDNAQEAALHYSIKLDELMEKADVTIGLYGIGVDGHIGGMLPSKAEDFTKFLDGRSVVTHKGPEFTRITTTSEVIVKLDKLFVVVCGKDKFKTLDLLNKDEKVHIHPAQLLKDAKDGHAFVNVGR